MAASGSMWTGSLPSSWRPGLAPAAPAATASAAQQQAQKARAPTGRAPAPAATKGRGAVQRWGPLGRGGSLPGPPVPSARSRGRPDRLSSEKAGRKEFLFNRVKDKRTRPAELEQAAVELRAGRMLSTAQDYTALVGALGKRGLLPLALEVLEDMQEAGFPPNVITYTAAITACEQGGSWPMALSLLQKLRSEAADPNIVTYNAAIGACGKGRRWEVALSLFAEVVDLDDTELAPTEVTYSVAMDACKRGKQWEWALLLKEDMRSREIRGNVIAWCSVIHACERCGQSQLALHLFGEMKQVGFQPDHLLYNVLLRACEGGGFWKRALFLLDKMLEDQIVPDALDFAPVMAACAQGWQWQRALELFAEMRGRGLSPDGAGYAAAILAYQRGGSPDEALALLEEAKTRGAVTVAAFTAAMHACRQLGDSKRQLQLFEELRRRRGLSPDAAAYNSALQACAESGQEARADGLLREMRERGLCPCSEACVAAIDRFPKNGDGAELLWLYRQGLAALSDGTQAAAALRLFSRMRQDGFDPGRDEYSTVIRACERSQKAASGHGAQLYEEMRRAGLMPTAEATQALVRMRSVAGHWEEALEILADVTASDEPLERRAFEDALIALQEGGLTREQAATVREDLLGPEAARSMADPFWFWKRSGGEPPAPQARGPGRGGRAATGAPPPPPPREARGRAAAPPSWADEEEDVFNEGVSVRPPRPASPSRSEDERRAKDRPGLKVTFF